MTEAAIALAAPLIMRFEGCRLTAYRDAVGVWTIGYGFTFLSSGQRVTAETPVMTQEAVDRELGLLLTRRAARVDPLLPPDATDAERAALYSFAWNEGVGALSGSTLLRKYLAGDRAGAADEFPKWVYAGGLRLEGLCRRRAAERALFLGEVG